MKPDDLLGRLRRGDIPALVVLYGEERWYAGQALTALTEKFLEGEGEGVLTLEAPRVPGDADGSTMAEVLDEARTPSMFTPRKVVYYRSRGPVDPEDVNGLAGFAKSGPGGCRLLLAAAGLPRGAAKKLTGAGAAVAAAKRPYENPWPGDPEHKTGLNRWVQGQARERGRRISPFDALLLTQIVGNDLGALAAALDRLVSSPEGGPAITEDQIRSLAGRGRQHTAFAFGEAVYGGDPARAFRVARNSFLDGITDQKGHKSRDRGAVAARLLWSVRYRLKDLYAASVLVAEGKSREEVILAMGKGKNPGVVSAADRARAFPPEVLRGHFGRLTDAEADLHRSLPEPAVIFRLIAELTGVADA